MESRAEKKLMMIVNEFFKSQHIFHADIRYFVEHFLNEGDELKPNKAFLTEEFLQANPEGLTATQKAQLTGFLIAFKQFMDNPFADCESGTTITDQLTSIAKIIENPDPYSKFNHMFAAFSKAAALQKDLYDLITTIGKHNFQAMKPPSLTDISNDTGEGIFVNDFAMKPVQRAAKYHLLLRQMTAKLGKIPRMDAHMLDKSQKIILERTEQLNETQRRYEKTLQEADISTKPLSHSTSLRMSGHVFRQFYRALSLPLNRSQSREKGIHEEITQTRQVRKKH